MHSMLVAAASSMSSAAMYDPLGKVYNYILLWNGKPAPPLEEWQGASSVLQGVFLLVR